MGSEGRRPVPFPTPTSLAPPRSRASRGTDACLCGTLGLRARERKQQLSNYTLSGTFPEIIWSTTFPGTCNVSRRVCRSCPGHPRGEPAQRSPLLCRPRLGKPWPLAPSGGAHQAARAPPIQRGDSSGPHPVQPQGLREAGACPRMLPALAAEAGTTCLSQWPS